MNKELIIMLLDAAASAFGNWQCDDMNEEYFNDCLKWSKKEKNEYLKELNNYICEEKVSQYKELKLEKFEYIGWGDFCEFEAYKLRKELDSDI